MYVPLVLNPNSTKKDNCAFKIKLQNNLIGNRY